MEGLSVIIVCHNGAPRLPATLSHLKTQESSPVPWEVLLIDNCSTDGTAEVACSCWQNGSAPIRIVRESRLGVRYARERGLSEAKYTFLGFVDDDNWVAPDWVRMAYEIISSDSRLAAVGSVREPACELPPPSWFDNFHPVYAVLTERDLEQMPQPLNFLPTAGLCIRKKAWEELVQRGFRFLLSGSVGNKPVGGEDTELTLALHLAGWKLQIDPRLRLQHFMPSQRLQWPYLRKLVRNYGASHVLLDPYSEYSLSLRPGFRRWLSERWWYQLGRSLIRIANRPGAVMAAVSSGGEGNNEVIDVEQQFGRVLGLLRLKGRYGALRSEVREGPWRCASNS
jgi:glycosyltransferase involved in cell wall biosynthesis